MEREIAELVDRIAAVRRGARRVAAAAEGLSLAQLDALAYLNECNRFSDTPAAVAEYQDATRGTISQTLLSLERKGLVRRRLDQHDRRVSHLAPTATGRRLLRRVAAAIDAHGVPTVAETPLVRTALEQALREAQRARGSRTFGECGTCIHLQGPHGDYGCGLTNEPLRDDETVLRCVEHTAGVAAG